MTENFLRKFNEIACIFVTIPEFSTRRYQKMSMYFNDKQEELDHFFFSVRFVLEIKGICDFVFHMQSSILPVSVSPEVSL